MNLDKSQPTPELEVECMQILKQWQTGDLRFSPAHKHLKQYLEEAKADNRLADEGRVEHFLGYMQYQRGRISNSIEHYDRAIACFEAVNNMRLSLMCHLNQGENYRKQGNYRQALQQYEIVYLESSRVGNLVIQTTALVNQGLVNLNLNYLSAAETAFQEAEALTEQWTEMEQLLPPLRSEIAYGLARVHLLKEEFDRAWELGQDALRLAIESQQPLPLGLANRVLAEILTYQARSDENLKDYLQTAEKAFREIQAEDEIAYLNLIEARYLVKQGKKSEAHKKYHSAMHIFTRHKIDDAASKVAQEMGEHFG